MKKLILLIAIIVYLIIPSSVSAHSTETDGQIRATVHYDPDDDPIVGEQTGFYFNFIDTSKRFTPIACDCTFRVLENGKEIYSQPLFKYNTNPNLETVTLLYTFPKRDVYQISIVAKPLHENAFQPFRITFDVRVERTTKTQQANPQEDKETNSFWEDHFTHSLSVVITLVVFGGFVIIAVIQKMKDPPKPSASTGIVMSKKQRSETRLRLKLWRAKGGEKK